MPVSPTISLERGEGLREGAARYLMVRGDDEIGAMDARLLIAPMREGGEKGREEEEGDGSSGLMPLGSNSRRAYNRIGSFDSMRADGTAGV